MGSLNVDITVSVADYPEHGETILGKDIRISSGGKGANQAVACKRLGAEVSLIGGLGEDFYGDFLLERLNAAGVDTDQVVMIPGEKTGTAVITIDSEAENTIIVIKGANERVGSELTEAHCELIRSSSILLVQAEVSYDIILEAMKFAAENDVYVVFDPAPVKIVDQQLLAWADVITPNRQETKYLTGIDVIDVKTAHRAAQQFEFLGVKNCIIKMGRQGAYVYQKGIGCYIEGVPVLAVDTVGAGDCFAGALSVMLNKGIDLVESAQYANYASALKVTRCGAQEGIPTIRELDRFIEEQNQ